MYSLPDFSKKLIENHLEELFTTMAYWLIGTIPQGDKSKSVVFTSEPPTVTLANLFVQSMRNNRPNDKEADSLKGMLRTSYNYIEGLKNQTKAKAIVDLESYISKQKRNGLPVDSKEAANILTENMEKAKTGLMAIVSGETARVKGMGQAMDIIKVSQSQGVDDPVVAFQVMKDAHVCKFCIANHLLPDQTTPRVYKMSEVSSGYLSQQDRKDGKISLAGQHPHCFAPSTRISTSKGLLTIKSLFDSNENVEVFVDNRVKNRRKGNNQFGDFLKGEVWLDRHSCGARKMQATPVYETGEQECLKITLNTGHELVVTERHEMWIDDNRSGKKIEAINLLIGQKIPLISGECGFGSDSFPEIAELMGNLMGDGSIGVSAEWNFFGNDIPYGEKLRKYGRIFADQIQKEGTIFGPNSKYNVSSSSFNSTKLRKIFVEQFGLSKKPRRVPDRIWGSDKKTMSAFLRGLYAADGHSENSPSIVLGQNDREFLKEIQLLLSNFGIISRIFKHDEEQEKTITYSDGRTFITKRKECWRLVAGGVNFCEKFSIDIGFGVPTKQEALIFRILEAKKKQQKGFCSWRIGKVEKIEHVGKMMTYCLTEPMTNTVTANGIVTGQCRCSMYFVPSGYGFKQGRFTFIGLNHDEYKHQRGENV